MKKLSPELHGILDYVTVFFLLISPTLFEMQTAARMFTYTLAVVHLALTLFTNFKAGVFKIIPLWLHGLIEIIVAAALIGIAIWFRITKDNVASYYYLVFAVILFIVWSRSEYRLVKTAS